MEPLLFWDVARRRLADGHRRFGTKYRSYLESSSSQRRTYSPKHPRRATTRLVQLVIECDTFCVGHAVAQLVEALRYKQESRGFDSRWCHWNFSLTLSFRPHYGVDSASNRNEYQEYFLGGKGGRCVGLTTLPPSCADCLEI